MVGLWRALLHRYFEIYLQPSPEGDPIGLWTAHLQRYFETYLREPSPEGDRLGCCVFQGR